MQRPDLATLACINADCQQFGGTGQGHLTIRKVYGKDGIRLLRCGRCHEEFSERRNTALFNLFGCDSPKLASSRFRAFFLRIPRSLLRGVFIRIVILDIKINRGKHEANEY